MTKCTRSRIPCIAVLLCSTQVLAAASTPGTVPATPLWNHSRTDLTLGQGMDGQDWATFTGVTYDYNTAVNLPYGECGIGGHQSPIAINLSGDVQTTNPGSGNSGDNNPVAITQERANPLIFKYFEDSGFQIYNSGHAVQVNTSTNYQGYLQIGSDIYPLTQFHFHTPAEHVFIEPDRSTKTYAGELHFVHQRYDGKIVVIAVMLDDSGIEMMNVSENLQTILNNLPASEGGKTSNSFTLTPKSLIPDSRGEIYAYAGSLTTPPCSEGVQWYVLSEPLQVTEDLVTLEVGTTIMDDQSGNNARVTQNALGRTVLIQTPEEEPVQQIHVSEEIKQEAR